MALGVVILSTPDKKRKLCMQGAKKEVLACEADPAELHRLLTNLPVLGHLSGDELCQQAASLYNHHRPSRLASDAGLHFVWSVANTDATACVCCLCAVCMSKTTWTNGPLLYTKHTGVVFVLSGQSNVPTEQPPGDAFSMALTSCLCPAAQHLLALNSGMSTGM